MIDTTSQQAAQLAYLSSPASAGGAATVGETADGPGFEPFGRDGFTFEDFIDIINPLQHIPIVSTLYREMTGDALDPGSRIGGGTLFGGPIGLVASVVNVIVDENTGKDVGEHVLALLNGEENEQTPNAQTAENAPAAARPWINPDADPIAEASFETASGQLADESAGESPILEGVDVLVWAQQEAAHRQRADAAGRAQTTQVADAGQATLNFTAKPGTQGADPVSDWAQNIDKAMQMAGARMNASPDADNTLPSGAAAISGGWFSDVMLDSLKKYQEGAKLAEVAPRDNNRPAIR